MWAKGPGFACVSRATPLTRQDATHTKRRRLQPSSRGAHDPLTLAGPSKRQGASFADASARPIVSR